MQKPAGLPESWIRYKEAGNRLGIEAWSVSKLVRNGYLRAHLFEAIFYIDWNEALQSRIIRGDYNRFQASLSEDFYDLTPVPRIKITRKKFEPEFA